MEKWLAQIIRRTMMNNRMLFLVLILVSLSGRAYSLTYCKIEFCNKDKSYCFHHDTAYPVDSIKKDPYKKKIRGTSRPSKCRKIADRLRSVACRNKYSMTNVSDVSMSTSQKTAANVKWTAKRSVGTIKTGYEDCL